MVMIIAHPDDEVTVGPLLALYAKNGADVYLVCVTSGQQGGANTTIPVGEELGAAREVEIRAACQAYGINPPYLLQLEDGGLLCLSSLEIAKLKERLRNILEIVGAQVVITFGPEGYTGHTDHIAVGEITTELIDQWYTETNTSNAPDKLYYTMFPESFKSKLPAGFNFLVGIPDSEATTIVDCANGVSEAQAAILEYETQWTPTTMTAIQSIIGEDVLQGQMYLRWARAKNGSISFGETDVF
ncbi:MAG: PIG-L family deacetylase [Flavobacteriaceae bacterium]|nr:PIG-L family deacetylase [Flavobacteriaceae bacterium]